MATELYTVVYIADASAFISGVHKVEQAVISFDAIATSTKKNINGMFGGAGRSANAASKNIDKLNASLNGVPPAATKAKTSLNGLTTNAGHATTATNGLAASMSGFLTVAAGITVATTALNIFAKAAEDAKQHLNTGAQSGLDLRNQARELANLLGKPEVDDAMMTELLRESQVSGFMFTDIVKFNEQFEGSLPVGAQAGHITEEQKAPLKDAGATFAARLGIDPATAGDLIGSLAQYTDLTKDEQGNALTAEQGLDKAYGQLNAMTQGLNDGKGEMGVLVKNQLGAASAALSTGHVKDHGELAAYIGVGSTISKGGASSGITFKQMDRLVNESQGEEGEFLKSIGVEGEQGDFNKLAKLKAHVDAQRQAAPDPSRFDPKRYLMEKGFHEQGEVDSTLGYLANLDVLKIRLDRAKVQATDGNAVVQANQAYGASQIGQERQGRATQEAGNYEQTRKRQRLATARKAAYGKLQAEGKIDTFGANLADGFLDGSINLTQPNTGHEARIDAQVWEDFRTASAAAGIESQVSAKDQRFLRGNEAASKRPGATAYRGLTIPGYGGQDPAKLDEALNTFGPAIEQSGVSLNGAPVTVKANQSAVQIPADQRDGFVGAPKAGAGGGGAAGGKVASVDASSLDKASEKLAVASANLDRAIQKMMGSPGSGLGDSYSPYRA